MEKRQPIINEKKESPNDSLKKFLTQLANIEEEKSRREKKVLLDRFRSETKGKIAELSNSLNY